jgi:hypothetical protein
VTNTQNKETRNTPTARKLSLKRIMAAISEDNYIGFCRACGAEHDGCEPDARSYKCNECGKCEVFGAEELLMMWA